MKNFFIFTLVLVLLSCSLASVAFAQVISTENMSLANQIQTLEKQVELLDQVNNKILNTIYWALGGLIAVFLAIVGLNFFQNFTLNKGKIDSIKKEMNNEFKASFSKLQEQNKKNIETLNTKVESKINLAIKDSLAQFKSKIDQLEKSYKDIKREGLIRKALGHKAKNQLGYILNLTSALELDIERGWPFRIGESLELILKCLDSASAFTNSDSLAQLQKALNKLPPEYSVQKKIIEGKMKL